MSDRTVINASIKRASKLSQDAMNRFDAQTLALVTAYYQKTVTELNALIDSHADGDHVRLERLQSLLSAAEAQLAVLEDKKAALIAAGLREAARLGVEPLTIDAAILSASVPTITTEAVKFVRNFIARDGLQLSDRIWINNNHARQVVKDAINNAVIQGHSASRAAQDLLSNGQAVSPELQKKLNANTPSRLKALITEHLFTGTGSPHANALRLFRTELNRAHGQAYLAGAFAHPDVIGTRFLLSPNHPREDICDMHARANLYGLGPGVYPKDKTPWPAHPNTLSYTEVVFKDEVTDADRAGKKTRLDWLADQPKGVQIAVLNSIKKQQALERGLLPENAIATPWSVFKERLIRQGHDPDTWE